MKIIPIIFTFFLCSISGIELVAYDQASSLENVPTLYKGRFRPMEAYAKLLLYEFNHSQKVSQDGFKMSALDFFWQLDREGHSQFDHLPLFWIQSADEKSALGLKIKKNRFSYGEITAALESEEKMKEELKALIALYVHSDRVQSRYLKIWRELKNQALSPKEISIRLETEFPIANRLKQASPFFFALPGENEWYPLKALKTKIYDPEKQRVVPIGNFTIFTDEQFDRIQQAYLNNRVDVLAKELKQGYRSLENQSYKKAAAGKQLMYPSQIRLDAELLYSRYPWILISIFLYGMTFVSLLLGFSGKSRFATIIGTCFAMSAFSIHTFILALRCFILMRPPVSNMFETVIYVPWIGVLASIGFYLIFKNQILLIGSSLISVILLTILKVSDANPHLENVQAVLDSQYWLIIHVLMIVGSYGVFILCALLGHYYLMIRPQNTALLEKTGKLILHSMYVGVALLIPGTILGGVWAAESWGRFWDWDPKESWAFISACIYLLFIHAYTFRQIQFRGLAIGSIIGVMAISFTWYGVNYILGTGLHSYGFGNGGEFYYFLYLAAEVIFLLFFGRKSMTSKTEIST